MNRLYGNELAKVYDAIYQGFIDYRAEYAFYAGICNSYGAKSVLELACGSGNLAESFSKGFEDYLGFDLSAPMLALARQKYPVGNFRQGDMRNFDLPKKYGIALITGRSTSYLLKDDDLESTFASILKVLQGPSLLVFDCIDANKFLPYIEENPKVMHDHKTNGIRYFRETTWVRSQNVNGTLVNWTSTYFKEEGAAIELVGNDISTFRAFYVAEISALLAKSGFDVLNVFARKTYAFDTFVVTAQVEKKAKPRFLSPN